MQTPENQASLSQHLDSVLQDYPQATVALSIRHEEKNISFDLNGERLFHAASTMKIPVMIEVFRLASLGRLHLEDSVSVENAFRSIVDNSEYRIEDDSDDAIYTRLGQKMSVRDLVYQMITVSSNLATNILIDQVSADSIQHTIESLGVQHMQVLRGVEDLKAFDLGMNNTATSADLAVLLEAIKDGQAVSPEMDAIMVDILLEQQFNEMIPSGLPADARVAHKTGQITRIHHDAGIVYQDNSEYVLVILIEGLEKDSESAALGARIAALVHDFILL